MTKDEALKMAIEQMNVYAHIHLCEHQCQDKDLLKAIEFCEKALEQQEVGDAEIKQMLNDIEYYQKRVEALEQPAQAITEGSQLSNIKAGSQSEKPSPPPAPKHTCTYSRTMNQEYPRKCIHCGEVEALAQPSVAQLNNEYLRDTHVDGLEQPAQEPVAWMDSEGRFRLDFKTEIVRSIAAVNKEIPLYTHPAPVWQGLSDDEIDSLDRWGDLMSPQDMIDFARAIEQALKKKNDVS